MCHKIIFTMYENSLLKVDLYDLSILIHFNFSSWDDSLRLIFV